MKLETTDTSKNQSKIKILDPKLRRSVFVKNLIKLGVFKQNREVQDAFGKADIIAKVYQRLIEKRKQDEARIRNMGLDKESKVRRFLDSKTAKVKQALLINKDSLRRENHLHCSVSSRKRTSPRIFSQRSTKVDQEPTFRSYLSLKISGANYPS